MPRRRNARGLDILDDAVEFAVDTVIDRASDAFARMRDNQRSALPPETAAATFTCAACRKEGLPLAAMEMVHPSNGFGTCKACFAFMWNAAKDKLADFAKRAARTIGGQAPQGAPNAPPSSPRKKPWEVLGVSRDASVNDIKKAYRALAMEWHPDRIPPGAPDGEKEHARAMFEEITRNYEVMMKLFRQAPTT